MDREGETTVFKIPVIREAVRAGEVFWANPQKKPADEMERGFKDGQGKVLGREDIEDAERRLSYFGPLIARCFPETAKEGGIIESPLVPILGMEHFMKERDRGNGGSFSCFLPDGEMKLPCGGFEGRLFLKEDSQLPIAGSVKARGGIYEILKHTEEIAENAGLLREEDSSEELLSERCREFFSRHTVQAGSTGNLGLSIGIMSAALGYKTVIHMSSDARAWKKELLRKHGVTVKEYSSDYSGAVREGRRLSELDPSSYFVDDENSRNLFLGYAAAAGRLQRQLLAEGVNPDRDHPLFVYLPCGVGGAPGGITFGLKLLFGDFVHCFFAEPVQSPCMLAGMATGLHSRISVQDIGLSGKTHADGLAVGRPSGFVGTVMEPMLDGIFTVRDSRLYYYMRALWRTEGIFAEPSACAGFLGPQLLEAMAEACRENQERELPSFLQAYRKNRERAAHIVWATGGSLVPDNIRKEYLGTFSD